MHRERPPFKGGKARDECSATAHDEFATFNRRAPRWTRRSTTIAPRTPPSKRRRQWPSRITGRGWTLALVRRSTSCRRARSRKRSSPHTVVVLLLDRDRAGIAEIFQVDPVGL